MAKVGIALLLGALGVASAALAEVKPASKSTASSPTAASTAQAGTEKAAKGTIASVNEGAKSFVVHTGKAGDLTIAATQKTTYVEDAKLVGWPGVKVGEWASVLYTIEDGKNEAARVYLQTTPPTKP